MAIYEFPEITFEIFLSILFLSPGLILSGENPICMYFSLILLVLEIIFKQISSVVPGATVLSKITKFFFFGVL